MNIYLVRHGRQNSDLCNVDVPLDEVGRKQAYLVGERLTSYQLDAIYSSRLIRAVQTAQIINQHLNVPYIKKADLKEIDFGGLEGLTNEEIYQRYGDFLRERAKLNEDLPYPGGECGAEVYQRAMPIFNEITANDYDNIAIVTHGGLIRSMLAGFLGINFAKKLQFAKELENCSITHVKYNRNEDRYYIERINDYAHLEHDEKLLRRYFKKGL